VLQYRRPSIRLCCTWTDTLLCFAESALIQTGQGAGENRLVAVAAGLVPVEQRRGAERTLNASRARTREWRGRPARGGAGSPGVVIVSGSHQTAVGAPDELGGVVVRHRLAFLQAHPVHTWKDDCLRLDPKATKTERVRQLEGQLQAAI